MKERQADNKGGRADVRRRRQETLLLLTAAAGLLLLATAVYGLRSLSGGEKRPSQVIATDRTAFTDTTDGAEAAVTGETGWQYTGWKYMEMAPETLSEGTLILVRPSVSYDPDSAPELVRVFDHKSASYFVRSTDLYAAMCVMDPLNRMLDDFAAESGLHTVNVVAGWRSYEYQEKLYEKSVRENGADYAERYMAKPGESEHHTGLAVDFSLFFEESGLSGDFDGTGAYAWIRENAWRYGFVLRYPADKETVTGISFEPWHYRYVGLPHAKLMEENGLCLEEYIDWLKEYPFDGEHLLTECLGRSYEIYYCAGGAVYVPMDDAAEVSGNNLDGYIVTVPRGGV